jgi:peroxiredoxin
VRYFRLSSLLLLASLALLLGCNRGAHPKMLNIPAPDFTVSDGTSTVHLANYRGKVVLLNLWATWCAPCVQEMPALVQLHHDHPELAILAVSVDEDPEAYKQFISERHVDLITVRDPDERVAKLYGSDGWPETYIIDRKGIIRRKVVGDPDWSNPEIRSFIQGL